MQDAPDQPLDTHPDTSEQPYDKLDLTAAAVRLGIGVDGVRRRLQRGTLRGIKDEGKWFVLLPQDNGQHDAEQLNQSAEQDDEIPAGRYVGFLEAQNEKL